MLLICRQKKTIQFKPERSNKQPAEKHSGPEGTRTLDLSDANRTLSQTELQALIKNKGKRINDFLFITLDNYLLYS